MFSIRSYCLLLLTLPFYAVYLSRQAADQSLTFSQPGSWWRGLKLTLEQSAWTRLRGLRMLFNQRSATPQLESETTQMSSFCSNLCSLLGKPASYPQADIRPVVGGSARRCERRAEAQKWSNTLIIPRTRFRGCALHILSQLQYLLGL